ncbi:hypothetical protein QC763_401165 [Podospora pseudopauciseta]|uniref:Ecp2 effector protein domain-containing protein n=1 Tax=Podospora pseudopauciseta TaxID=2093780 RepID=A0ABR0HBY2_9PEZI|nr:hypothetical protein QC763_401165 [Podospora pseudopauciseta]
MITPAKKQGQDQRRGKIYKVHSTCPCATLSFLSITLSDTSTAKTIINLTTKSSLHKQPVFITLAKFILLALFSAIAVNSFVVPEGTADSLYYKTYDEADNKVLIPIIDASRGNIARDLANLSDSSTAPRSELEVAPAKSVKRQRSGCGTRYNLAHGDCDLAYERLKDTCGNGIVIGRNSAISAVAGSVVSYMCTHSNRDGV